MSKKERIAGVGGMLKIGYWKPETNSDLVHSKGKRKRRRESSPGDENFLNIAEGETSEIDGMSRSDYEMIHHAEERLKRREELDIKAFALQESTARLEREKFEILKRRCESDEARVNVEKERLLQDRMK
jgi:hypothetical protein